ncbi:MAG: TonB-dependent receptor [Flavobacteriales bacterium]|nr:TonB-dependent receptor [Flavobacteriales bacterium]
MKYIIALIASISIWNIGHAQVKGVVLDDEGNPAYALVYYKGTQLGTVTNAEGEFSIGIPKEAKWLMVTSTGHYSDSLFIDPGLGTIREVKFNLRENSTLGTIHIDEHDGGTHINGKDPQTFQVMNEKELCKAACCSLSESFETNGSVDASFTDGITGTRQIKMLGLDGKYTQILFDNMPAVRGLSSTLGLSFLPGPWINTISIAKGAGSVVHGYEGVTGQINVAHKAATMKENLFLNMYASSAGRYETNILSNQAIGEKWNYQLQAHGSSAQKLYDTNNDEFLDNPLFKNYLLRNAWQYTGEKGLRGEYGFSYGQVNTESGQIDYYRNQGVVPFTPWISNSQTEHAEFTAKTGYMFDEHGHKSLGSQINIGYNKQVAQYGYRYYEGIQKSARINLLFANEMAEGYNITAGLSATADDYRESLTSFIGNLNRVETTYGVFGELNANPTEKLQIVAGMRADENNLYGLILTPRIHARYSITEKTSVKISSGKAYRSPQMVVDHLSALAGNRTWNLPMNATTEYPFGFEMEEAVNSGIVLVHNTKLFHRTATFTVDAFHTNFQNQLVADYETAGTFSLYNLSGKSFANAVQTDFTFSPIKRSEIRLAYRWLDAQTTYTAGLKERPLVAKHRVFINLAYATKENAKSQKWNFDFTARWLGPQRLANQSDYVVANSIYSPAYWTLNTQISFFPKENLEFYAGGENITGYMIHHPIHLSDNTSSDFFDASQVYGPMFGANYYVGLRWRIGQATKTVK